MAGLDPAIHVFLYRGTTWMPGTSPGMTTVFAAGTETNYPVAPASSRIGPNSSQRWPSNFIICSCLLTR